MKKSHHMFVFAHIVEAGSITGAAVSLQLSKSVVSQHLKALEQELGVLLIKRSTRKHTLTTAGSDFYQSCKEINELTDMAWQRAQESIEAPKGLVKITAPNALMDSVIAPAIGKLLKQYPQLEPQLISGDAHLNLMSDNIDLAIRVGRSQASNIKQRRIGGFRDVLCGSPILLAKEEIDNTIYIANTWQGKHINHQLSDSNGNTFDYVATAQCSTNSFYACLALIKEGAGIGLLPDFQFNTVTPALGEVFPGMELPMNQVFALYPYDTYLPLGVKVCIEAIENNLSKLSRT